MGLAQDSTRKDPKATPVFLVGERRVSSSLKEELQADGRGAASNNMALPCPTIPSLQSTGLGKDHKTAPMTTPPPFEELLQGQIK